MTEQSKPRKAQKLPQPEPWKPAEWEEADAHAIRAVANGTASEDQQVRAMKFIIHNLCSTYDLAFRPGGSEGDRATAFAEGKRWPGLQLVKLINLNLNSLRKAFGRAESEQPG
jgi:hypothetical protein